MADDGCRCWGCRPDLMHAEYDRLGLEPPTEQRLRDEVKRLNTELDGAIRQRDSLARRCAVRFEETQKLRDELVEARRQRDEWRRDAELNRVDAATLRQEAESWKEWHADEQAAAVDALPSTPEPATSHGYTTHGHKCCDQATGPRPSSIAKCGGPGLCHECGLQAHQRHGGGS